MIAIDPVRSLSDRIGEEVAVSGWVNVSQDRIDAFAESTGDRQWIHVDADRAAAESPSKCTIAHGFLTLSLVSAMLRDAIDFPGVDVAINYGLNRVRFVSPVPVGARLRGRFVAQAVEEIGDAVQVTWNVTLEREHGDKPACVAEWIVRYQARFPAADR